MAKAFKTIFSAHFLHFMAKFSIRPYKRRATHKKKTLYAFLNKLGKSKIPILKPAAEANAETWGEVACLDCANCCKKMTPTFNKQDITRISKHLNMTRKEFSDKWLMKEKSTGDIVNKKQPCQFLGKDNKCSIYEVRPLDCAEFPHFVRKDFRHQVRERVFHQNIHFCPATLVFVEKLQARLEADL